MAETAKRLLFIEPQEPPASPAVLDSITRKMCAGFRQARTSNYAFAGVHVCRCGANSSCTDHFLPDGTITNSLCIHYVAHHRNSVPNEQLGIIDTFLWGEAEPTVEELLGPDTTGANLRRMVELSLEDGMQVFRKLGLNLELLCAYMRSYEPSEREDAEELFHLLLNMKHVRHLLLKELRNRGQDELAWGEMAVRLPNWDRMSWLAPMIAMLKAGDERMRRSVASQFSHLRKAMRSVPSALIELRDTSEGELKQIACFAIRQISND